MAPSGIVFSAPGTAYYTIGSPTIGTTIALSNSGGEYITVGSGVGGAVTAAGGFCHTIQQVKLTFANNLSIDNNGAFGFTNLTISGGIDRVGGTGTLTVNGTGNTRISTSTSALLGSGISGIIKNGTGTLILGGSGGGGVGMSSNTGGVTVTGGVLSIAAGGDGALGVGPGVSVGSGAALRYEFTSIPDPEYTFLFANNSVLDVLSGMTVTVSGAGAGSGQLLGSGRVNVVSTSGTATSTLSVESNNDAGFVGDLVVGSTGSMLVGHILSQRAFVTSNTTQLRLQDNTTTGWIGSIAGASSLTLNRNAALIIVQPATGAATTGRTGMAPITFNNGRFQYTTGTNGGAGISETLGSVTATGQLTVNASGAAGDATNGTTLNFGTLTRKDMAVFAFRSAVTQGRGFGGQPGAQNIRLFFSDLVADTTSTGIMRSVLPWASHSGSSTGDPTSLMTYDANGFRALDQVTEVQTVTLNSLAAATSGANVRLTGAGAQTVASGGQSVNALLVGSTTTLGGGATVSTLGDVLTVSSGGVVNTSAITLSGVTLNFPNGGYLHLANSITANNNSRITGEGGLAVTATSFEKQLRFAPTNTADGGNLFTGGLFINGNAQVYYARNNHLGNDGSGLAAGAIALNGGQLVYSPGAATPETLSDSGSDRAITVGDAGGTIATASSGATVRIPGLISGTGQIMFGGVTDAATDGVVELTNPNANTYSGGTVIGANFFGTGPGILRISNANQLGTGPVVLNGGTLQSSAPVTFAAAPLMGASSTIDTFGSSITLSDGIKGTGGTTGTSTNSIALTKTGTGTLAIGGTNDFVGTVTVNAGTFRVDGTLAMSVSNAVNVNFGATVEGNGSVLRPVNINAGGTLGAGANTGQLTIVGQLTMAATSSLAVEIEAATPGIGGYDQVVVNGPLNLGGATLAMTSLHGYSSTVQPTDRLFIINNDGTDAVVGRFTGLPVDGSTLVWGVDWSAQISYTGDSATNALAGGNDVVLYNIVFATGTACSADFNGVGGVTIDDLFLYINAYFQGLSSADFNGMSGVTIDDLFLYINAYFAGC